MRFFSEDHYRFIINSLRYRYPEVVQHRVVAVSVVRQGLYLFIDGVVQQRYSVSTSRYGTGSEDGSLKTPFGAHRIIEMIGQGAPSGTIFKGRQNTHEIAKIIESRKRAQHDCVTSRILRLEGMDPGGNRGNGIDTYARYIYIHGTHEEGLIGEPASVGCVRMRNQDVIELFERVKLDTLVFILE